MNGSMPRRSTLIAYKRGGMNRYEEIAAMIVDEGKPMLLMGGGRVTELKLRYCPECGSSVKLQYGMGLRYFAVTWHCSSSCCIMSNENSLHGWNEYYQPNPSTLLIETLKEILWQKQLKFTFSS